jgi:DNA polymerase (family 10)
MESREVAATLEEIGLLLELLGENPFKTRAYHNGARIIRGLEEDLAGLVQRKELTGIKGIGSALAEKITTLVREERLHYLEELRAKVPPGLLEWIRIPGLGAKKARAIHVALDISTLGELEYACIENRLRDLQGFGEASQKKILTGIELIRRNAGRFHQHLLHAEAERLLGEIRRADGVIRAEIGGSVRRRTETSMSIDIVVAANEGPALIDRVAALEGIEEIIERDDGGCRAKLATGPLLRLLIVPDGAFPFALWQSTGSEKHASALRAYAAEQGNDLDSSAQAEEEREIYESLELDWIPPELREGEGEIEAASRGELPLLIQNNDIRGLLHNHSRWSDGSASIEVMAEATRALGMEYLAICDHSRAAAYAGGLDEKSVRQQHEEIDELNGRLGDSFRVLKGIEVDILPDGSLDFEDNILATFDVVVASVHSGFNLGKERQTARILRALENPFVDILGHVTGRLLLARDGYALDLERVLEAAAERKVAVEINAHPHRLDLDWRHLRAALARGLKTCINPDAHSVDGLSHFTHGVAVARKGWCTREDAINAWPLGRLLDFVRERRP